MPKKEQGYFGDKILASYQALSSCLCLSLGSVLAAVSFKLASEPEILRDWQRKNPGTLLEEIAKPRYAAALGALLAVWTVLVIVWIAGTWKSRRWALWLHLLWTVPQLMLAGMYGRPAASLIPVAVFVYTVLRLNGNLASKRASVAGTKRPVRRKPRSTR